MISPAGSRQEKAAFDFIVSDDCNKRASLRFNKYDYDVLLEFLGFAKECGNKEMIEEIHAAVMDRVDAAITEEATTP